MSGFDASTAVEKLGYDFTAFGGGKGDIPEPTPEQVATFWAELLGLYKLHRKSTAPTEAPENESAEDAEARLRQEIADGAHRGAETIDRRRELVAALCSDKPSLDELRKLPARILAAFEGYIMEALSPEASSTATK